MECKAINYTIYFYRNLLFSSDKEYVNDSLPVHAEILRLVCKITVVLKFCCEISDCVCFSFALALLDIKHLFLKC